MNYFITPISCIIFIINNHATIFNLFTLLIIIVI
jgi:hypothetical protein